MRIEIRQEGDVTFLDLDGKLTIGAGDLVLRSTLQEQLAAGARKLLINMQGVRQMDSSGLGELVRSKVTAGRHGAVIKLLHLEEKARQMLQMTRLIGVFESFDDETDAVTSFGLS